MTFPFSALQRKVVPDGRHVCEYTERQPRRQKCKARAKGAGMSDALNRELREEEPITCVGSVGPRSWEEAK